MTNLLICRQLSSASTVVIGASVLVLLHVASVPAAVAASSSNPPAAANASPTAWPKGFAKPGKMTRVGVRATKDGGQLAAFTLPGTPSFSVSDARFVAWKKALVASGRKVASDHRTAKSGQWSASFILPRTKRRAFITWLPTQQAIHGVLRTVPNGIRRKMPGRCVRIPTVRFSTTDTWRGDLRGRRGNLYRDHKRHYETSYSYDVDGDGTLDALVPVAKTAGCLHHAQWDVYVIRGRCGHRLGRVHGPHFDGSKAHGDADASGFKPLHSSAVVIKRLHVRGGGQEQRGDYRRVSWKNHVVSGRYRTLRRETKSKCTHCAVLSRCRGPSGSRRP